MLRYTQHEETAYEVLVWLALKYATFAWSLHPKTDIHKLTFKKSRRFATGDFQWTSNITTICTKFYKPQSTQISGRCTNPTYNVWCMHTWSSDYLNRTWISQRVLFHNGGKHDMQHTIRHTASKATKCNNNKTNIDHYTSPPKKNYFTHYEKKTIQGWWMMQYTQMLFLFPMTLC